MKFLRHVEREDAMKCESHAFLQVETTRDRNAFIRSAKRHKYTKDDRSILLTPDMSPEEKDLQKETGRHQILPERDTLGIIRQDPLQQNAKAEIGTERGRDHNKRQWITHTPQVQRNTAKILGIDGQLDVMKLKV